MRKRANTWMGNRARIATVGKALVAASVLFGCSTRTDELPTTAEDVSTSVLELGAPGRLLFVALPDGGGSFNSTVHLYNFQSHETFHAQSGTVMALAAGDANNDGVDDVAFGGAVPGDAGVVMYTQNGPFFPYPGLGSVSLKVGDVLSMGDIDNDGFDELIVANQESFPSGSVRTPGQLTVYTRNGPLYEFFPDYPGSPDFFAAGKMAVCDLNNDGFDEIVVADPGWRIYTHQSVTDPSVQVENYFSLPRPAFNTPYSVLTCADLNDDDFDDLVIGDGTDGCIQVVTHPSRPAIVFDPAGSSDCVRTQLGDEIAAGDLNDDGFAEIMVGRSVPPSGSVLVYASDGHTIGDFFENGLPTFFNGGAIAVGKHALNALLDSDDDGIPDVWEINGFDENNDGCIDLDLPAMGANPFRKDIFVEIDAMDCTQPGSDCAGDMISTTHNHMPTLTDLQLVIDAFANAPVNVPPGAPPGTASGINLHIQLDGMVMHVNQCSFTKTHCAIADFCDFADPLIPDFLYQCNPDTPSCFDQLKAGQPQPALSGAGFGTAAERAGTGPACPAGVPTPPAAVRRAQLLSAKAKVFHYSLWGHQQAGSAFSGLAEGGGVIDCPNLIDQDVFEPAGNDLLITLYGFAGLANGSPDQRRGTFMHELGHNLGLEHGGGDKINDKPNYLSVMNYSFQMGMNAIVPPGGTPGSLIFDYSSVGLPDLNEMSGLGEGIGIQSTSNILTFHACPSGAVVATAANQPIDWNCNGALTDVVTGDINGDRLCIQQSGTALDSTALGDDFVSAGQNGVLVPGPDGKWQSAISHVVDASDVATGTTAPFHEA